MKKTLCNRNVILPSEKLSLTPLPMWELNLTAGIKISSCIVLAWKRLTGQLTWALQSFRGWYTHLHTQNCYQSNSVNISGAEPRRPNRNWQHSGKNGEHDYQQLELKGLTSDWSLLHTHTPVHSCKLVQLVWAAEVIGPKRITSSSAGGCATCLACRDQRLENCNSIWEFFGELE